MMSLAGNPAATRLEMISWFSASVSTPQPTRATPASNAIESLRMGASFSGDYRGLDAAAWEFPAATACPFHEQASGQHPGTPGNRSLAGKIRLALEHGRASRP